MLIRKTMEMIEKCLLAASGHQRPGGTRAQGWPAKSTFPIWCHLPRAAPKPTQSHLGDGVSVGCTGSALPQRGVPRDTGVEGHFGFWSLPALPSDLRDPADKERRVSLLLAGVSLMGILKVGGK